MGVRGFRVAAGSGEPSPGAGGRILADSRLTDGGFSLLLSHAPTGDSAPLHVHDRESESFYVLEGAYRITCGDDVFEGVPGDFVHLPQGLPHAWTVVSPTPAAKLVLAVPGGMERFFDDLADGASPDDLAHRHGVRFLSES